MEESTFLGNLMFASTSKLSFKKTTRKDDLISLAYMLMFIVCGETLPFLEEFYSQHPENPRSPLDSLQLMKQFK